MPRMNTNNQRLSSLLRWVSIAAVALAAILVGRIPYTGIRDSFTDDPALTPQAEALLTAPENPYPDSDNLYLALVGFDAPEGETPLSAARQRIARAREIDELGWRDPKAASLANLEEDRRQVFLGDTLCEAPDPSLWRDSVPHQIEFARLRVDNAELFGRYLSLHELSGFFASGPRTRGMAEMAGTLRKVRCLYLADLVIRLRRGGPTVRRAALEALAQDAQVWRRVLHGEGTSLTARIGETNLAIDYQLLVDILSDTTVPAAVFRDAANAVEPLLMFDDWNVPSFQEQFRKAVVALQRIKTARAAARQPTRLFSSPLEWLRSFNRDLTTGAVKLTASQNLISKLSDQLTQIGAPNPQNLRALESYGKNLPEEQRNPFYLQHIKGVLFPDEQQVRRELHIIWDLAAFQRLLHLGYEIRRQQLDADAIPALLRAHPEWATHPADGRPFLWKAQSGELCARRIGEERCGWSLTFPAR